MNMCRTLKKIMIFQKIWKMSENWSFQPTLQNKVPKSNHFGDKNIGRIYLFLVLVWDVLVNNMFLERLQLRGILEWVAISFSGGSSRPGIKPRPPKLQADSLPWEDGKHILYFVFPPFFKIMMYYYFFLI